GYYPKCAVFLLFSQQIVQSDDRRTFGAMVTRDNRRNRRHSRDGSTRAIGFARPSADTSLPRDVRVVIDRLRANLHRAVPLAELAAEAGVSPRRLREVTGRRSLSCRSRHRWSFPAWRVYSPTASPPRPAERQRSGGRRSMRRSGRLATSTRDTGCVASLCFPASGSALPSL